MFQQAAEMLLEDRLTGLVCQDDLQGQSNMQTGGVGGICLPGYFFVANGGGGCVNVIDRTTNAKVDEVGVGSGPWAVTALPDGSRLYTPDRWSKTVSVIGYR